MPELNWSEFKEYTRATAAEAPTDFGIYEIWSKGKQTQEPLLPKYIGYGSIREKLIGHHEITETNEALKNFLSGYYSYFRFAIPVGKNYAQLVEMTINENKNKDHYSLNFQQVRTR